MTIQVLSRHIRPCKTVENGYFVSFLCPHARVLCSCDVRTICGWHSRAELGLYFGICHIPSRCRWLSVSSGIVFLSNNWLILKIFTHPYSDHFRTDRYSPKTRKSEIPTTAAPRSQLPYMPALSSSRSRSLLRSVEAGSPPAQAGIASLVPGPSLFQCVSFSLAHFKPGTPPTLSLLDLRHNLQMFL